jgi:hypothetical protein
MLVGIAAGMGLTAAVKRRAEFIFLFAWLFVMLLPAVFGWQGMSHALRAIGAIPPVFLLTAVGADWVQQRLELRPRMLIAFFVLVGATCFYEYYRYFNIWAKSADMLKMSKSYLTDIAEFLNTQPATTPRFVIVNDYGEFDPIDPGQPEHKTYTPAQTVIFLTRESPHPRVLQVGEALTQTFPSGSLIVPLLEDPRLFPALRSAGIQLTEERHDGFVAARVK